MANTAKNKAAAKQPAEAVVEKAAASIASEVQTINKVVKETEYKIVEKPVVKKELPADLYVPCVSMIRTGKLVYVSKRQIGYTVVWQNFEDVQYVELKELMAMRSSEVAFFQQNWIAIEDEFEYKDEVMEKLRIKEMYKNAPTPSSFDHLFVMPLDEMAHKIEGMSQSLKHTVWSYAKECVGNGSLDSLKRIRILEKALGKQLS